MRAPTFAALFLAAATLPLSAHAHHDVSCDGIAIGDGGTVDRFEARLRGAIRASVNAGCDPFGGLMGKPGCDEHIAEIRDLAHQIEFAGLRGDTEAKANCLGSRQAPSETAMVGSAVVSLSLRGESTSLDAPPLPQRFGDNDGADRTIHSSSPDQAGASPLADVRPIPPKRRNVRAVGPVFLPDRDARFEAIAKGAAALPDSAANALVSWLGFGSASHTTDKSDRQASGPAVLTVSAE